RGVVERHDIGVLETGHQQRLALKPLAKLGIGRDMIMHDLDDYLPAKISLPRQIDSAHASLAEKPDRLIPTQKNAADHRMHQSEDSPAYIPRKSRSHFHSRQKKVSAPSPRTAVREWRNMYTCLSIQPKRRQDEVPNTRLSQIRSRIRPIPNHQRPFLGIRH